MPVESPTVVETGRGPNPSTPPLRIHLLGGFGVRIGGEELPATAWAYRTSARTLLKLLALHPEHRIHREQIADILWPDASPESASSGIRKALHALRHALEPDLAPRAASAYLTLNSQLLQLSQNDVWIDVESFQELSADALAGGDVAALEAALDVYAGELLPEDRYEDWAEAKRRELNQTRRELVMRVAAAFHAGGEIGTAPVYLERLLEADPTDEEAYQWLIRLHLRHGSRHAALLAYRRCQTALTAELGVEPSPETERLHAELLSGMVQPPSGFDDVPVVPPPQVARERLPLAGRTDVLEQAGSLLRSAESGSGSLLLLGGEPGVGKTRLAVEIARNAVSSDALVLWGTAFEEEALLPYALFADCLGGYLGSLDRDHRVGFLNEYEELQPLLHMDEALVPHVASESATEADRARVYRGVARLMTSLATTRTVVVVLDDLQFADPASLRLLQHLARAAVRLPWLLIGTYREEALVLKPELAAFVQSCSQARVCHRIDVHPLNRDESRELTASLIRQEQPPGISRDPNLATSLFERSRGNALFLVELIQNINERPEEVSGTPIEGVPQSVREFIKGRLSRLSPDCTRALALASVAGMQWSFQLLRVTARNFDPPMSEARLVEALDEALASRILEELEVGGSWGYVFRHPLIQAALYESLSQRRKLHLHESLARSVEALSPEEVELLAYHFSRSEERERAVQYLEAAAERALSLYANEAALAYLLELAKRLQAPDDAPDLAAAQLSLGKVFLTLAQYDKALEAAEIALSTFEALEDEAGAMKSTALIAETEGQRGRPEAGIDRLAPLVTVAETQGDPAGLMTIHTVLAKLYFLTSEYGKSLESGLRMRDAALGNDDRGARDLYLGRAESCIGVSQLMIGQWEEARLTLTRAIELSEGANDLESLSRSLNNLGSAYADAGNFPLALVYLERALEVARRVGDPTTVGWQLGTLANIANMLGDWNRAESLLQDAMDMLRTLDQSWFSAYPIVQLAHLALLKGEADTARELLRQASTLVEASGDLQISRWTDAVMARLEILDGRHAEAIRRLRTVEDRPGFQEADVTFIQPILAEALLPSDLLEAGRIARDAAERARAQHDAVALIDAIYMCAQVAMEESHLEQSLGYMNEMLELSRSMSYPYAEAQALLGLAGIGMRQDSCVSETTRAQLGDAREIFVKLGARPYVQKVDGLLAHAL